jgi:hypothetical protein
MRDVRPFRGLGNKRGEAEDTPAPTTRALAGKVAGNWSREKSNYSDMRGTPSHHCGPSSWWPTGSCQFYREEHKCAKVAGYIAHHGVCDWWKPLSGSQGFRDETEE